MTAAHHSDLQRFTRCSGFNGRQTAVPLRIHLGQNYFLPTDH